MKYITLFMAVGLLSFVQCRKERAREIQSNNGPDGITLTAEQVKNAGLTYYEVSRQKLARTIHVSGRITYDDLRVSHVFSPVTGRVSRIFVSPGQNVRKGEKLAEIQSPDIGIASSDLDKAKADYVAAEHEFNRANELYELHAGAKRDLDLAQDNFQKAKAEMERARQKARLFQSDENSSDRVTQNFILRSPISGEVVSRSVSIGMEVSGLYGGSNSVELFTIGNLDHVWVLADVYEMDMASVRKGSEILMDVVAFPDQKFKGRIDWMATGLDPLTRTLKIRCVIPNRNRQLRPEMYANVSITIAGKKALAVPRKALLRLGDRFVVFVKVAEEDTGRVRFQERPVEVDETMDTDDSEYVPVLSGLDEKETIVSSGAILLTGEVQ